MIVQHFKNFQKQIFYIFSRFCEFLGYVMRVSPNIKITRPSSIFIVASDLSHAQKAKKNEEL